MNFLKKYQYILFACISFVLLFLSFTFNVFSLVDDGYHRFDRGDEGYTLGRIIRTEIDGFFSDGGLPGNYVHYDYLPDEDGNTITNELLERVGGDRARLWELPNGTVQGQMYDDYINNRKLSNDGFRDIYKTQPNMMGNVYGALHLMLPIKNAHKLYLFRFINIFLTALAFVLIACWAYRKFGATTGIISFVFILFTPWFMRYSHNLWWALWSFYIPFITMIFVLDKKQKHPDKISDSKVLLYLFLAVFVKFLVTGAEFISSAAVMATCPIIYYLLEEKRELKASLIYFLKSCIAVVAAVIVGLAFLIMQIKLSVGTWQAGIDHIIFSFVKRSAFADEISTWGVFKTYLVDDYPFMWNFFPYLKFGFGVAILIICAFCAMLYWLSKRQSQKTHMKSIALILTTIISIIGPLSWIIIFAQHAYVHTIFDYITWYMPFMLYAYMVIGYTVQILFAKEKVLT